MKDLRILAAALAVWRITHMFENENGAFDFIKRRRVWLRRALLASLAEFFYCLSLWLAVPFAFLLAASWLDRVMLWPSLSGAAVILNHLVETPLQVPSPCEDPF